MTMESSCVMRSSSVAPSMHHFCGPAVVFDSDASAYAALMDGGSIGVPLRQMR